MMIFKTGTLILDIFKFPITITMLNNIVNKRFSIMTIIFKYFPRNIEIYPIIIIGPINKETKILEIQKVNDSLLK